MDARPRPDADATLLYRRLVRHHLAASYDPSARLHRRGPRGKWAERLLRRLREDAIRGPLRDQLP